MPKTDAKSQESVFIKSSKVCILQNIYQQSSREKEENVLPIAKTLNSPAGNKAEM